MAKAIILLLLALVISTVAQLRVISFILNRAVELGLIALLIIFQPELRRFLEQMGSGKLKEMFTSEPKAEEQETAILQTVDDYGSMSKDKVGALMVFERKTLLDDVIKTGTPLDCSVSSMLLKNLFWNKAPLHDGAALIRDGRVCAAGCILPLTQNNAVSSELGTRHRAALGMSEQSDAIVVVVSEERGSISIAHDGILMQDISDGDLREKLQKYLIVEPEQPGEISRTFKRIAGRIKHGKKQNDEK